MSETMTRPALGQHIQYRAYVAKHFENQRRNPLDASDRRHDTVWERYELDEPVCGVYVGFRTVAEGHYRCDRWDGEEFQYSRRIRVWAIVPNERSNPVYVLPEDVEILEANTP